MLGGAAVAMHDPGKPEPFCFVSCDIVGHGLLDDVRAQQKRIRELNDIVRKSLSKNNRSVWASGGDGGHVGFSIAGNARASEGATRAIELMKRLFDWAHEECVSLRITGHVGEALRLRGADDRTQLVGDGINDCGSVIDFGDPSAIVVTNPFRDLLVRERVSNVTFKEERTVYLKHFAPERLFLLDIEGAVSSRWGMPSKSEHQLLNEARDKRLPWQTIYHAKRLLQSNTADVIARDALEFVATEMTDALFAHDRDGRDEEMNQFLSEMDPTSFFEFLLNTELVERKHGERLCQADEEGDTMFIVLSGEVGVVVASAGAAMVNGAHREAPLDARFGPGRMVGELAFALRRSRTAALQAIGRTAVLAFNYRKLENVLSRDGIPAEDIRRESMRYFQDRSLEYLCNHAPFLIGPEKTGPLASVRRPWRWMRGRRAEIYQIEASKHDVISADDPLFRGADGLYALAGGQLERGEYLSSAERPEPGDPSATASHIIDGRRPQILWVDMPGTFVHTLHTFRVKSEHAVIIRVSYKAFQNMKRVESTLPALKRALLQHYRFDVFLAYDKRNHPTAVLWAKALREHGLSVYMNNPVAGEQFKREILSAMLTSAVLIPLITSDVAPATPEKRGKPPRPESSKTWVHAEVDLRRALFPGKNCNIVPVQHPGGNAANVTNDISSIVVTHESKLREAISEAFQRVQEIKTGDNPVPFSTRRTSVPKDFT